ncbi:MAG: DUF4345 domain-containing protein [Bacteroidota bacterium]
MKRGLQIILYILTLIPLVFWPLNLIFGAAMHMPAEHVNPNIDSHIRFQFTWFFGLSLILWYIIPKVEQHTTLFRIIILTMTTGGVARLVSIWQVGMPDTILLSAAILEILLIALIPWQTAVVKMQRKEVRPS